jgi:hypothetical protein
VREIDGGVHTSSTRLKCVVCSLQQHEPAFILSGDGGTLSKSETKNQQLKK